MIEAPFSFSLSLECDSEIEGRPEDLRSPTCRIRERVANVELFSLFSLFSVFSLSFDLRMKY